MQAWMIGLVSGVICVASWPVLPPGWTVVPLALLGIPGIFLRSRALALPSGFACGCLIGVLHGVQLLQSRVTDDCVGSLASVTGTVTSLPTRREVYSGVSRQRFEFTVKEFWPVACSGPEKLLLYYYGEREVRPDEEWQFDIVLRKTRGLANPGLSNMQSWYVQNGIDATGSVRTARRLGDAPLLAGVLPPFDTVRKLISERIDARVDDAGAAAILRAITVADSSGIDRDLWFLFQQYGLNHLLVISGLHVTMIAGIGYLAGGLLQRLVAGAGVSTPRLPALFALFSAALYGGLAGFTLPVQRALTVLACFVIANMLGRQSLSRNNLVLAATAVLLLNPLAALGSGFWLSFGAVSALLWFSLWQRSGGRLRRVVTTQFSISLLMLPLGALFFGGGSLVAMLANLLMIPLIGWVVVPLALVAVICSLNGWQIEGVLWELAALPLRYLLPLASSLAQQHGNWLYLQLDSAPGRLLPLALGVLLVLLPGRMAMKSLALLCALPVLLPPGKYPVLPGELQVLVLDVGQGTAVLLRAGGRALLYDTGPGDPGGMNLGASTVLPVMRHYGVGMLDTLIVSHPHLDHSAGTGAILDALAVQRFRYGGKVAGTDGGRQCLAGESWRWPGGLEFRFLSPAAENVAHANDVSCVLQVDTGAYRLLLPGDIERSRERMVVQFWGEELQSDWLLAGHHGSRTSTTPAFLKHARPTIAVFSNGYRNRFGHPHASVVESLEQHGVQLYSTATDGALEFRIAPGGALSVLAYRHETRRYWM